MAEPSHENVDFKVFHPRKRIMTDIAWILHQTSHPGNVGSAARAIKTMGFKHLTLAEPQIKDVTFAPEAIALASGADDVLAQAVIHPNLAMATAPFSLVFGLSARDREFGPPCLTLKEATQLAKQAQDAGQASAFLFGTERTGLSNEDFAFCSHRVWIDANPNYASLNLAQAVMVCAYEMRQTQIQNLIPTKPFTEQANIGAIQAMMEHLTEGLIAIEFLNPSHPKKLIERLRAMFDRAGLQVEEVDILRGIAKQMLLQSKKN
jgi:tRNA/rRNA methyltransferase